MKDWIDQISENDREKVSTLYEKAKDFKDKLNVLRDWHPKGYLNVDPIGSLEEYFKYIRYASNVSTWFRGESKDHEHLIPKLYRGIDSKDIDKYHDLEKNFFYEFRRRAIAFEPNIDPNNKWSVYFLIQHYGGPTRLLDWTQNAAIALFFALDTSRENNDDPVVILLAPTVLSDYAFDEISLEKPERGTVFYPSEGPTDKWLVNIANVHENSSDIMPGSPIALLPPYSDQRITAQNSCFTLFGKKIHGFYSDGKQITCPSCSQKIINKLIIDGNKKVELRHELIKIGVSSGKVFPGLDGLCREISEEMFNS